MSVHLLKDGRWICRHEKGKDPERPNANKRYFGRGLEAERAVREFDIILHEKTPKGISSPLFVDIVNEYLSAKKMTMTKVSWDITVDKMRRVILPIIGQMMGHELSPKKIDWYAEKRAEDGVNGRPSIGKFPTSVLHYGSPKNDN